MHAVLFRRAKKKKGKEKHTHWLTLFLPSVCYSGFLFLSARPAGQTGVNKHTEPEASGTAKAPIPSLKEAAAGCRFEPSVNTWISGFYCKNKTLFLFFSNKNCAEVDFLPHRKIRNGSRGCSCQKLFPCSYSPGKASRGMWPSATFTDFINDKGSATGH